MKKIVFSIIGLLLSAAAMFVAEPLVLGINAADVSALSTYAAAMQRPLIATLINGLDVADDIVIQPNVKNSIPLTKLRVGKGFRPYSATHEPESGNLVYTDRILTVATGKRDLLLDSEDYANKYLAWQLSPGSGANKKEIPFAQFTWNLIMKQLAAEINDGTVYFGFDKSSIIGWVGPSTTYSVGDVVTYTQNSVLKYFRCISATTASQSPDTHPLKWTDVTEQAVVPGLKSYITTAIGASTVTVTATGAITDGATALTAFTKLFRSAAAVYKKNGMIIHAPYTDYEYLMDGVLATYSKYTREDLAATGFLVLPNTSGKCIVKPTTWLTGSRRLIMEPNAPGDELRGQNLIMGTDLLSDMNEISAIPDVYTLKTGIKLRLGFQIQDLNALILGDQS